MRGEQKVMLVACALAAFAAASAPQAQTMMDRLDPGLRNRLQNPWDHPRTMTRAEHERGMAYVEHVVRSAWDAIGRPDVVEVRSVRMMAFDDPATVFSFCGQIRGPKKGGPFVAWKSFGSSVSSLGEVATAVEPDPRWRGICVLGERPSWADPEGQFERTVKAFNARRAAELSAAGG